MSYRRRRIDLTLPIAQLAVLVALGFVFMPQFRVVAAVGLIVVGVGLVEPTGSKLVLLVIRSSVSALQLPEYPISGPLALLWCQVIRFSCSRSRTAKILTRRLGSVGSTFADR